MSPHPPITTRGATAQAEVAYRLRRRSRRGVLLGVWNSRQRDVVADRLAQSWGCSRDDAYAGLELAASPTPTSALRERSQ